MVGEEGVGPSRSLADHWILSPERLPFRHSPSLRPGAYSTLVLGLWKVEPNECLPARTECISVGRHPLSMLLHVLSRGTDGAWGSGPNEPASPGMDRIFHSAPCMS